MNEFETAVLGKLDRIIELLELQTFVPEDAVPAGCQHEQTRDMGTMGMEPGAVLQCVRCFEIIRRT